MSPRERAASHSVVDHIIDRVDQSANEAKGQKAYATARWWQRRPDRMWLLVLLPVVLFLFALFLYPLLKVLLQSVLTPHFSLANYRKILGEQTYLYLIWNTIRISFEVAIGTLVVGCINFAFITCA